MVLVPFWGGNSWIHTDGSVAVRVLDGSEDSAVATRDPS